MNANLELYRVFCEVVKYKNISKAAENIYISQSAVTQSIQKLERILVCLQRPTVKPSVL